MTTDLLNRLNGLIHIMEASIPANPDADENAKLERSLERILVRYFHDLSKAFPYDDLEAVYNRYVVEESIRIKEAGEDEAVGMIEQVLSAFRTQFLADITGRHIAAYMAGSTQTISWGKTKAGIPITYEGPPIQQAIDYASTHCATMVTRMEEETRKIVAHVVSDGIENKRGVQGLARDLRSRFGDMSRNRSMVIARTETADALEQGFLDAAKDMGVTGKQWVVTMPCEICEQNADVIVPLDGVFPSGHERPPAHPTCRCALAPVMMSRESLKEKMTPADWKKAYEDTIDYSRYLNTLKELGFRILKSYKENEK